MLVAAAVGYSLARGNHDPSIRCNVTFHKEPCISSFDGQRLPDGICFGWGGVNDAGIMWDKLFKKHENIVMAISGHIASDYVIATRDTGENGNEVIQMMVDHQGVDGKYGPAGLVTVLYFSAGGSKVFLETYAAVRNEYFFCTNQYEFDIPVVKAD